MSVSDTTYVVVVSGDHPRLAFFNPAPAAEYAQWLRDQGEGDSVEVVEVPLAHAHPTMLEAADK